MADDRTMISLRLPRAALEVVEQHRLLHDLPSRSAAIVDLLAAGAEARTPRGEPLIEAMRAAIVSSIQDEDARAELASANPDTIRGAWIALVHAAVRAEDPAPERLADVIPIH